MILVSALNPKFATVRAAGGLRTFGFGTRDRERLLVSRVRGAASSGRGAAGAWRVAAEPVARSDQVLLELSLLLVGQRRAGALRRHVVHGRIGRSQSRPLGGSLGQAAGG